MKVKHKRTKEEYEEAIKTSVSIAEALRKLGISDRGGNYRIIRNAVEKYGIDISHFSGQGWNKGLKYNPNPAVPLKEILKEHSVYQSFKLKKRLIDANIKEYKCERCLRSEWEKEPIPLELHHINGDNTDNRLENLMLLCPNCHALTDNYRGRNKSAQGKTSEVEPA